MNYDASPTRIDEAVTVEELRAILAGDVKGFGRRPTWLAHLLTRNITTIEQLRRSISLLHRDVQAAAVGRGQMGAPTTLSPVDAMRFLTPEQRAVAIDEGTRKSLDAAERARAVAEETSAQARRVIAQTKLTVGALIDDPSTPLAVRYKLESLLTRIDQAATEPGDLGGIFS